MRMVESEEGYNAVNSEANPMHVKIARANVAHAGLGDRVDMRLGVALDLLPTLATEGPFYFIYIDADQVNSANYFQWAVKLSRRGSLIVTDNVIRHGSIIDTENCKPAVQGLRRFYDRGSRTQSEHHRASDCWHPWP